MAMTDDAAKGDQSHPSTQAAPERAGGRLVSLDLLRGLIVLVMLFVNDLAGVAGAPAFMKHVFPSTADGMTFVDVVFPAFLLMAGMSLPLALERRLGRGESLLGTARHVFTRAGSLLLIGALMVNAEHPGVGGKLDPRLWSLLLYLAVALIWITPGAAEDRWRAWRQALGFLLLVVLALTYRGQGAPGLVELRPSWWGILGLIGWAYLVTSLIYLAFRKNPLALAAAIPLLYCVYCADRVGYFGDLLGISRLVSVGSMWGSHAAITATGALLGTRLLSSSPDRLAPARTAAWAGLVLASAAVLLHALAGVHPMFFYNKNAATVPWCLLSSAFTAWLFAAAFWLIDVRRVRWGTATLALAGQNALFAFIVGPVVYELVSLLPSLWPGLDPWAWLGSPFPMGLSRSLAFAAAATWLTALLHRRGLTLRV
jgi:heparan-alpha-glucosaminide N-acetyltransferase